MTSRDTRRAMIIGTGLIGGSIGLALRRQGWCVTGHDRDQARATRARELGALDAIGRDEEAQLTFVATPVGAIAAEARRALEHGGVVTDVGSVKAPVVAAVAHSRFVGGHPMAGSEQEGVDGADAELFTGGTWVLTPAADTDPGAYALVHDVVSEFGAEVLAVPPDRHDALVALVSHVPHLTAATLMGLAADGAEEHSTLLRLAAGGFRDMTRIAAGHPGIWLDICAENRDAIAAVFDDLLHALAAMRERVVGGDRDALLQSLEKARLARMNLPVRAARPEELVELRVPVRNRAGVLAEVTTLCGELNVNIEDIEVAHTGEGDAGVLIVIVGAESSDLVRGALLARGFRPSAQPLA